MKVKLSSADWLELIKLGVTTVGAILKARAERKAALAVVSPEVADMPLEQFEAVFAAYYTAEDRLAMSAVALIEAGDAEKGAGG